jgi:Tfp pilus assembly protein PilF
MGAVALCLAGVFCLSRNAFAFDRRMSFALSHYIMAGINEKSGDLDNAAEEYKKALRADYRNAVIHLNLASIYLKKKDVSRAIAELNLAVKFDPESVEPHAILALLYFSQEKLADAGSEYEKALENASRLEPRNSGVLKKLGLLYLEKKNYKAAEDIYKKVLELSPDDPESRFLLSNVYDEQKNRGAAVIELKKVLELKPDYHQALNYLGYLYVEENRELAEAEKLIKKAVELSPDNGAYIDSLGWLYFKQGNPGEAKVQLEKAAGLLEDPVIYDHLGDVYYSLNDREKSRINWEKSLKLKSDQGKVKEKIKGLKK